MPIRQTYVEVPDPKDRTPNQPAVILEPKDISEIGRHAEVCPPGTNDSLRDAGNLDYVIKKAKEAGWGEITLTGKQIILIAKLHLETSNSKQDQ